MNDIIIIFAVPLVISFLLALYIMPRMRIISYNGNAYLRHQKDEIMGIEMGGLSLFPIILISMCFALALPQALSLDELVDQVQPATLRILQMIVGCSMLYLIGIKDDFHGTGSKNKFLVMLIAAVMFPATGLWIDDLHGLFGIHEIPMWVGVPLTVFIAMYLTELPAMTDSPDGLSTWTFTVLVALFFVLTVWGNHALSSIIASSTLGVTMLFTIYKKFDRRWKKTLMGSSGNFILGYILSYLTIGLINQCGRSIPGEAFMLCIGIVFVPVMDSVRVLKSRVIDNRDILTPDKNQMQHRLFRAGLLKNYIYLANMLIILMFAIINFAGFYFEVNQTIIFFIDIVVWAIGIFIIDWLIARNEARTAHAQWNKEYGREAWEANVPTEILSEKIKNFGTMGLPADMVTEDASEFIPDGMSGFGRFTKRLFDLMVSGFCLILFSPLFLLCYILIKLDDGGPAIFKQERLGQYGRPFMIYKFRSMRLDAEKSGPKLSHAGGDDDPRLTKVGCFLRAHHLDELPQLWNVFVGEMAFIGYRPERKFYIDQIMKHDPRYVFLYQIRPGVTSYATLKNGYTDTMEKMLRRLELDLYYLKNRSWWFDIKMLMLTFLSIIFGKKF